jgi:hypothetical protein
LEATFVVKFSRTGRFVWARQIDDAVSDAGAEIAVDGSGNVHIAGHFSGIVDFDPGPGVFNLPSQGRDIFIAKWSQP